MLTAISRTRKLDLAIRVALIQPLPDDIDIGPVHIERRMFLPEFLVRGIAGDITQTTPKCAIRPDRPALTAGQGTCVFNLARIMLVLSIVPIPNQMQTITAINRERRHPLGIGANILNWLIGVEYLPIGTIITRFGHKNMIDTTRFFAIGDIEVTLRIAHHFARIGIAHAAEIFRVVDHITGRLLG